MQWIHEHYLDFIPPYVVVARYMQRIDLLSVLLIDHGQRLLSFSAPTVPDLQECKDLPRCSCKIYNKLKQKHNYKGCLFYT